MSLPELPDSCSKTNELLLSSFHSHHFNRAVRPRRHRRRRAAEQKSFKAAAEGISSDKYRIGVPFFGFFSQNLFRIAGRDMQSCGNIRII